MENDQTREGTDRGDPTTIEHRDLRFRKQFFPGAEDEVFDTSTRGFAPLPILLRKLLRHLTAPEVRVLIYLYTRASKFRICYPSIEEMAEELGLHRKNVTPHIKTLEKKKLIRTHTDHGRKYYLLLDPRVAIQRMVSNGEIDDAELFMLNELCRDLKRAPFARSPVTRA
jgi:DNA-binding MarR family transcriptional regulator